MRPDTSSVPLPAVGARIAPRPSPQTGSHVCRTPSPAAPQALPAFAIGPTDRLNTHPPPGGAFSLEPTRMRTPLAMPRTPRAEGVLGRDTRRGMMGAPLFHARPPHARRRHQATGRARRAHRRAGQLAELRLDRGPGSTCPGHAPWGRSGARRAHRRAAGRWPSPGPTAGWAPSARATPHLGRSGARRAHRRAGRWPEPRPDCRERAARRFPRGPPRPPQPRRPPATGSTTACPPSVCPMPRCLAAMRGSSAQVAISAGCKVLPAAAGAPAPCLAGLSAPDRATLGTLPPARRRPVRRPRARVSGRR